MSALDCIGGMRDGLHARSAITINGFRRDGLRQAGAQSDHARHIQSLLTFGESTAKEHIFDFGRVEIWGPLQ
jgi:hypothetical protein